MVWLFSSCVKQSSFELLSQPKFEMVAMGSSSARCNLSCDISNSGRRVVVKDYQIKVKKRNGDPLVTIKGVDSEKITISRGDNIDLQVPLNLKVEGGLMGLLSITSQLKRGDLLVDLAVKARAGVSMNYIIEDMPIKDFLKMVGGENFLDFKF